MILSEGPVVFGPHGTWVWSAPIDYGSVVFDGAGLFPNAGTFYHDASSRKNNGTLRSNTTIYPFWENELDRFAYYHNGTADSSVIQTPIVPTGTFIGNAGSFGMWVRWDSVETTQGYSGYRTTNASLHFGIFTANELRFGFGSTYVNTALKPTAGRWYHIMLTYDGTNMRGYADGVLRAGPSSAAFTAGNSTAIRIGECTGFAGNRPLTGATASPMVLNSPLSPFQITWLANRANNPWQPWRRKSWAVTGAPPVGNRRRRLLLAGAY